MANNYMCNKIPMSYYVVTGRRLWEVKLFLQ